MASQVIIDICLTIGSIANITTEWSPRFNFNIYFQVSGSENYPCPYLITQQKNNWKSSFDLRCYKSDSVLFSPRQQRSINEACVFRASVPMDRLNDTELTCVVQFQVEGESLGSAKFQYETCIGVCSFLPIFSPGLGATISAKIQTQLLGIRGYKNFLQDSTANIHKVLQALFHDGNRLASKIKTLQNINHKQDSKIEQSIQSISNILTLQQQQQKQEQQQQQQQVQKQKQYAHSVWLEYVKLKEFKPSRIFRSKMIKEHREDLIQFLSKIRNQYGKRLQFDWQKYLQLAGSDTHRHIKELRKQFIENFALEIKNKIIRNKGLMDKSTCSLAIGQIKSKVQGFQLLQPTSQNPQTTPITVTQSPSYLQRSGPHLLVLVHGLGANSYSMSSIERTIRYLYPHVEILNSKANQEIGDGMGIEHMGRNLAVEVEEMVKEMGDIEELRISFIGHSLGGVVIRAALTHLSVFKQNMDSFISLASPHLGHISHPNKLTKLGMSLLNSFQKSQIIDGLLLRDGKEQRLSYLYSLSMHSGLSWFRSVTLYGGDGDGYVSAGSALVESMGIVEGNGGGSHVAEEMARNLNQYIQGTQFQKYLIKFRLGGQGAGIMDFSEILLGRASHVSFPTHQAFINFVLLNNYGNFREKQIMIMEETK